MSEPGDSENAPLTSASNVSEVSPNLERTVKEQQWATKKAEIYQITDRLEHPIDEGIKDAIIALNLLDVKTDGSCEGHPNWATGGPYIDVEVPRNEALEAQVREAYDRASSADSGHNSEEDISKLWDENRRLNLEVRRPAIDEARKLMGFLGEFYDGRQTPYDRMLTLEELGGEIRIQSKGVMLQSTAPEDVRAAKLAEYQAEMGDFTAFLKGKFFETPSGNTGSPTTQQQPTTEV